MSRKIVGHGLIAVGFLLLMSSLHINRNLDQTTATLKGPFTKLKSEVDYRGRSGLVPKQYYEAHFDVRGRKYKKKCPPLYVRTWAIEKTIIVVYYSKFPSLAWFHHKPQYEVWIGFGLLFLGGLIIMARSRWRRRAPATTTKQTTYVKYFTGKFARIMVKRYGAGEYYTWQQVLATCKQNSPKMLPYIKYGYALFCSPEAFAEVATAIHIAETYEALRKECLVDEPTAKPVLKMARKATFTWHPNRTERIYG